MRNISHYVTILYPKEKILLLKWQFTINVIKRNIINSTMLMLWMGMWKYMELNPKASVEDAATAIVDEAIKHYAVWFMINQDRYDHRYRILMYYDNGYNQANGDDL